MKKIVFVVFTIFLISTSSSFAGQEEFDRNIGWSIVEHTQDYYVNKDGSPGSICRRDEGDLYPHIKVVEILSTWAAIEPIEGFFDWKDVDHCIDYWHSKGRQIRLRINTVPERRDSDDRSGAPSWIYDYGIDHQIRGNNENWRWKFADKTSGKYQELLEKFMNVYANRYKNDDRIDAVDLRAYGAWGEWHEGWQFNSKEERKDTLKKLIDIWYTAWDEKKPLILPLANEFNREEPSCKKILNDKPDENTDPVFWNEKKEYCLGNENDKYRIFQEWYAYDNAIEKPYLTYRRDGFGGGKHDQEPYPNPYPMLKRFTSEFKKLDRELPIIAEFQGPYDIWFTSKNNGHKNAMMDEAVDYQANYFQVVGWSIYDPPEKEKVYDGSGDLFYQNEQKLMGDTLKKRSTLNVHTKLTGDFDGDDRTDMIYFNKKGEVWVALSDGNNFLDIKKWHHWFGFSNQQVRVGDVNGDGKDDIINFIGDGQVFVALSDGTEFGDFYNSSKWHNFFGLSDQQVRAGDVDGDGKDDIISFRGDGQVFVALSDGERFGDFYNSSKWHNFFGLSDQQVRVGDVNGDGKEDIINFIGDGQVFVALSDGKRFGDFYNSSKWHNFFGLSDQQVRVGDVNGDGKDDIINFIGDGQVFVALSDGKRFGDAKNSNQWHNWSGLTDQQVAVGDVDNDGKNDIINFLENGKVFVALSDGTRFGDFYNVKQWLYAW
jgi:hypothetical protein